MEVSGSKVRGEGKEEGERREGEGGQSKKEANPLSGSSKK